MPEDQFHPGNPEIGIVVRDLEAMTRFYRDGVGLVPVGDLVLEGGRMRRFGCAGGVIKLLRMDGPPEASSPSGGVTSATGLRYLTIAVDDIDRAVQSCIDAGGAIDYPMQRASTGTVFTILHDPEGNNVELVMRPAR
jgi:catechol 2,3-dioxygenase-like lactoylglutathione lyase family enzyme